MRASVIPNAVHSFHNLRQLQAFVGQPEVAGAPITVSQDLVDAFADIAGDHHRARSAASHGADSVLGPAFAQGMLALALVDRWYHQCFEFPGCRPAVNYGFNQVRFIAPVQVNSRLVGRFRLQEVQDLGEAVLCSWLVLVQAEGAERPVASIEWLTQLAF